MNHNEALYFSPEHTWIRLEDGLGTVGISAFAQDELGEIVYVDLPRKGESFQKNEVFGSIEALKTVSDLFMPLSGKVIEVNAQLADHPTLVNEKPFAEGWLIKISLDDEAEREQLLTAEAYTLLTKNQDNE